ncbi:TPA: hypothetical protein JD264_18590 [Serratia fonticola]|nr:hypothetical protein [Serratia fonticola]
MMVMVNFIGELFLSIRFVLCAICAGFNRLRWVFFSEFAGRRSYFDPYLSTVVVDDEDVRKPVAGHARRGGRINRMGRIRKNVQGTERGIYRALNAKTPRILSQLGGRFRNQGVQKQALACEGL